jgi:hypothetical protein
MIYSDYASSPRSFDPPALAAADVPARLKALKTALFGEGPGDAAAFRDVLRSTHLFEAYMTQAETFIAEEFA